MVQLLSKTSGLRVTFDSSATKPAPTSSWDIDVHGRQVSQGRDDDRQPASCPGRGWDGPSIRETSNQMPQQEGGCPNEAPHSIPSSFTPVNTLPQLGSVMRASPRNPLKNLTHYRCAGWIFFEYLGQCQEEWRTIKSSSLDVTRHSRGPLLEFFLAPQTSSLTFEEVIQRILAENRYKTESSLDNVWKLQAQLQRELKDLSQAHKVEPDKSS